MKCWHLVAAAALSLAACGLNSAPDTQAGRPFDAGANDSAAAADMGGQSTIAGSPASWPTRRRPPPLDPDKKDGGTSDTKGGGKGGKGGAGGNPSSAPGGQSGSTSPGQSGPSSGGKLPPGAKGGQADAGTPSGSTKPSNGSHGKTDAGSGSSDHDAGSGSGRPSQHGNGNQHHGSSSDPNPKPKDAGQDNGGHNSSSHDPDKQDAGSSSGGATHGSQSSDPVGGVIKSIVDLVLAIIDISLGPAQPADVEHLVAAILVLSLSPVELAADSLSEVLDALDQTRICRDNPAHCDPLCQDLEKECRVCDHDEDCIQHIEDTCGVHLPSSCY